MGHALDADGATEAAPLHMNKLDELERDYHRHSAAITERRIERDRQAEQDGDVFSMVTGAVSPCLQCGGPFQRGETGYFRNGSYKGWHTWCYPLHR